MFEHEHSLKSHRHCPECQYPMKNLTYDMGTEIWFCYKCKILSCDEPYTRTVNQIFKIGKQ